MIPVPNDFTRIPIPISAEADRRTLVSVLASAGLEVRITKDRTSKSAAYKYYVEYRTPAQ